MAFRLPEWNIERRIGHSTVGIFACPGLWSPGLYWETDPWAAYLRLPLAMLWIELDRGWSHGSWPWCWYLARIIVGKQEIRLGLSLNDWAIGVQVIETNDWSIHFGPLDLQLEHNKFWANDEWTMPATLRLFPPKDDPSQRE